MQALLPIENIELCLMVRVMHLNLVNFHNRPSPRECFTKFLGRLNLGQCPPSLRSKPIFVNLLKPSFFKNVFSFPKLNNLFIDSNVPMQSMTSPCVLFAFVMILSLHSVMIISKNYFVNDSMWQIKSSGQFWINLISNVMIVKCHFARFLIYSMFSLEHDWIARQNGYF